MQHPQKKAPKQKSRLRPTIITGIALLLVAALLILLPKLQKPLPPTQENQPLISEEQNGVQTLWQIESDLLHEIIVTNSSGSYTLRKKDDRLFLQDGDRFTEIREDYSKEWLSIFCNGTIQGVVLDTVPQHNILDDMGLLTPAATAEFNLQNGEHLILSMGNTAPETTYAYGLVSGFSGVYLLDSGIVDMLNLPMDRLLPVERITLHSELVSEITRRQNQETLHITFAHLGDHAIGSMMEPFVYPLSESGTNALLNAVSNFYLGSVCTEINEENATEYGFDAPLALLDIRSAGGTTAGESADGTIGTITVEPNHIELTIGKVYNDYYYTAEYNNRYYLLSRVVLKYLVETPPDELITHQPANVQPQNIKSVAAQFSDQAHLMTITRDEQLDENGNLVLDDEGSITYIESAALDGQPVPFDLAQRLIQLLNDFTISGKSDSAITEEAVLTLSIKTFEGENRILSFCPIDIFFDAVGVNETFLFICESDFRQQLLQIFRRE